MESIPRSGQRLLYLHLIPHANASKALRIALKAHASKNHHIFNCGIGYGQSCFNSHRTSATKQTRNLADSSQWRVIRKENVFDLFSPPRPAPRVDCEVEAICRDLDCTNSFH